MNRPLRTAWRPWSWAFLTVLALLGCATPPGGQGERDITTASDETEAQKRARIRLELAAAYFAQGQARTALDEIKQALQADPNSPQAYNLRGLVYSNLGEDRLAEESFRRALQLDGRDADARHNYGWFLCNQRRYRESYAQFDAALAIPQYREPTKTLLAKGVCQARAGELADAEATLMKSYEMDPGNPATAMNLAAVLHRRGDYERARFYVRRVNAVPQLVNAESLWLAARIEHKLGNRGGARDFGEQLRRRFPGSREAAAFEQGRYDE